MTIRTDVAVVGLGPIGAGALRHLAHGGADVVGIGAPEGAAAHGGPFASHHDAGRITRRIDRDHRWAVLAQRSIAAYPALEAALGEPFHHPTGMAYVRHDADGVQALRDVAARLAIPVDVGAVHAMAHVLGELALPSGATVVHEASPAGRIDPRGLVAAQRADAAAAGARVLDDVVVSIERTATSVLLRTSDGEVVDAARVVLATGAASTDLLAGTDPLAVDVIAEPVVRGVVDDPTAERLGTLPTLIWLLEDPSFVDAYLLPIARYPDGTWQVKLGATAAQPSLLHGPEEVRAWMAAPVPAGRWHPLRSLVEQLLPRAVVERWAASPCLITDTATGLPYVDLLDERIVVAVGGNGSAAKSGDAIGALAAGLTLHDGRWLDDVLLARDFAAVRGRGAGRRGSRR